MSHDHAHHTHSHHSTSNLKVAFFLNLGFTIFEIIGGCYTNSVAILSDAVHDLGDSLSLGLSWYLDGKSKQKSDHVFSFGYQRFSLLGALVNGTVLVIGSIFILSQTLPRLINPETPDAFGMMWIAIVGVLVNGAAVLRIKDGQSLNERMVSWHLLEDVLGWVAVLIVSVVLQFWDIPILDPLLSLLILGIVLFNVIKNLLETFRVFLQAVPKELDVEALEEKVKKIHKVVGVHHTHIWSLDGAQHVLTIHIVIAEVESIKAIIDVKSEVKSLLRETGIQHATIEVEFQDEHCYMVD
jgi:cobalt-zinc-cadmium efflux system protein